MVVLVCRSAKVAPPHCEGTLIQSDSHPTAHSSYPLSSCPSFPLSATMVPLPPQPEPHFFLLSKIFLSLELVSKFSTKSRVFLPKQSLPFLAGVFRPPPCSLSLELIGISYCQDAITYSTSKPFLSLEIVQTPPHNQGLCISFCYWIAMQMILHQSLFK